MRLNDDPSLVRACLGGNRFAWSESPPCRDSRLHPERCRVALLAEAGGFCVRADLNGDAVVGAADLAMLLSSWNE